MSRTTKSELRQLWQQRVVEQTQSGLSVTEFCRTRNLQPYNFYYWRRKLDLAHDSAPAQVDTGLIPVRVVRAQVEYAAKIQFASGATIEASAELMRIAIDQIIASERALFGARSC